MHIQVFDIHKYTHICIHMYMVTLNSDLIQYRGIYIHTYIRMRSCTPLALLRTSSIWPLYIFDSDRNVIYLVLKATVDELIGV